MKDWLDSDEFKKCVNRLHDFDAGQKLSVIPLEMLKDKIREHFVPKPQWIKITDDPATPPPLGPALLAFRSKHEKFIEPAVFNFKWQEWDPIFDSQRLELEKDYEPVAWMPIPEFPE